MVIGLRLVFRNRYIAHRYIPTEIKLKNLCSLIVRWKNPLTFLEILAPWHKRLFSFIPSRLSSSLFGISNITISITQTKEIIRLRKQETKHWLKCYCHKRSTKYYGSLICSKFSSKKITVGMWSKMMFSNIRCRKCRIHD